MAGLFEYLDWRGDVPFSADPFNEVDNLVLSELAYVDFEGLVPGPESGPALKTAPGDYSRTGIQVSSLNGFPLSARLPSVPIQEVCTGFWKKHTKLEIERSNTLFKRAPFLLEKLCSGARFGTMRLAGYINQVSEEKGEQFSAIICILDDETVYVAFRGTDDTLIGWKEDFTLCFMKQTAGQKSAEEYLSRCFGGMDLSKAGESFPIRVGGHSKGGNFAVYAAAFCRKDVRARITDVYTNDGPGFLEEIIQSQEYRDILPRVHSIIPEESIFGLLLENGYYHKVIKSSNKGLWQHDALSWKVMRNRFEEAYGLSEGSILLEKTIESWINDMSFEERREVVDTLFSLLFDTGAENISEFTAPQLKGKLELLRAYIGMDREERHFLQEGISRLFKTGGQQITEDLLGRISSLWKRY